MQGKSAADLAAELAMSGGLSTQIGGGGGSDVDSDEEVYGTAKAMRDAEKAANVVPSLKTAMAELSNIDHSKIEYNEFNSCFYEEDPEIFSMTEAEVIQLRCPECCLPPAQSASNVACATLTPMHARTHAHTHTHKHTHTQTHTHTHRLQAPTGPASGGRINPPPSTPNPQLQPKTLSPDQRPQAPTGPARGGRGTA